MVLLASFYLDVMFFICLLLRISLNCQQHSHLNNENPKQ